MTPLQAIKAKYLECCGGDRSMVKTCNSKICPLLEFRFGHNPYRKKRELTDEQKVQVVERLAKGRERKNNNED